MFIPLQLFAWFTLVICLAAEFSPDKYDYNAYGSKVASNNFMIVQADNQYWQFYIILGNYTDSSANYQFCVVNYPDYPDYSDYSDYSEDYNSVSAYYIYTVVVGKSPSATPNIFFVGAMIDSGDDSIQKNATFVGVISYNGSLTDIDCTQLTHMKLQFIGSPQEEHLVLITDPLSTVAYGFADNFTFSYNPSTENLTVSSKNSLAPSKIFIPFAGDYDGNRGIIAGLYTNQTGRQKYVATVILFSINASTAIATQISNWTYPLNSSTWQATVTFTNVDTYNPMYDMSVSINSAANQVLVGIQMMNSVFLFNYTTNTLTFVSTVSNGQGIGFGKGVAWLRDSANSIAILANVYSAGYVWSSSQIYIYDSPLASNSTFASFFPNSQQVLDIYISPVFINIITTPDDLVFLDEIGNFFIILSAPAGYYSTTTGPSDSHFFAFSSPSQCIPGTYRNVSSIRQCRPCPAGTKNDGTNATGTTCVDCAANAFCPLGSITDSISNDQISNVIQVFAYPESPDITGLDDIMFFTLFSISSTGRCVVLSPIFWTLIVAAIFILITVVMLIIKYCVKDPKIANSFEMFRTIFQRADLIREGDMWPGGGATLCVLILCIFCCVFSADYYKSYPIETAKPSTYSCDTTIYNAQFSTSLRPLSVPGSDDMQDMIDLLDKQADNLNLDVSFLNTNHSCPSSDETVLNYLKGSTWVPISLTQCNTSNYIMTYSAVLPYRLITIQFTIPNTHMIGGLRLGLNAPGKNKSSTIMLQDLGFSHILQENGRMLGQDAHVSLQLMKVINKTSPLVSGNDDVLSGIWTSLFTINYPESFMTDNEYLTAPLQTFITLTIVINEAATYILNEQNPIARLPEIVYHDFLFITMIIGMFVLIFIIIELLILPCAKLLFRKFSCKKSDKYQMDDSRRSSTAKNTAPAQEGPFTSIQSTNRF